MAERRRLSDRIRELETQETVVGEVGRGVPTHRAGVLTIYLDQRTKRVYICLGDATWRELQLSNP